MTAIIAIFALGFTVFRGLIDKPGSPPGEIGITTGGWLGPAGGLLILIGSGSRTKEAMITRQPPGLP